jgi:hypothetical protein
MRKRKSLNFRLKMMRTAKNYCYSKILNYCWMRNLLNLKRNWSSKNLKRNWS